MDAVNHNLEQKTAQLRSVGQISAALGAAWKLEGTLEAITRLTLQVMGVERWALRSNEGQELATGFLICRF